MKTCTCDEFTELLASKAPVPGGGGAAALVGAIGVALGNMNGSLTSGKTKYSDVEDRICAMNREAEILRVELLDMIKEDADSFLPLSHAYRLPETTPEEKSKKNVIMEKALFSACTVPISIMEYCCRGIDLCIEYSKIGSSLALSDAAAGICFCKSALMNASLNVYINTRSMLNRDVALELNNKADGMLERYCIKAELQYKAIIEDLKNTGDG